MAGKYSEEFREDVVRLVRGGMRVMQVAEDMGVPQATIYHWFKQADVDESRKPASSVDRWRLVAERAVPSANCAAACTHR